jgi:hypothetical protein
MWAFSLLPRRPVRIGLARIDAHTHTHERPQAAVVGQHEAELIASTVEGDRYEAR